MVSKSGITFQIVLLLRRLLALRRWNILIEEYLGANGKAKEIISVDIYGDTQEIIEDCLDVLEPFIEEVIPKERKDQYYDYSEVIEIDLILEEYFNAAW